MGVEDECVPGYNNPPIAEAVISIEYDTLSSDRLVDLKRFAKEVGAQYPDQHSRLQHQTQIQIGATVGAVATQIEDGVTCISTDRKRIAQFALSSVAFSRLAPYGSWGEFEQQVKPLWERFREGFVVTPRALGVRYINRIEIPSGHPMERYIRSYPEVSSDLPQSIHRYFMRIEIPIDDGVLVMQQGFLPSSSPDLYAILLDNYLRYDVPELQDVWPLVLRARLEKNRIFEACITDNYRERLG